jgi:hypothetical protein
MVVMIYCYYQPTPEFYKCYSDKSEPVESYCLPQNPGEVVVAFAHVSARY